MSVEAAAVVETGLRNPRAEVVARRLERIERPLIQVHAWPGMGGADVLESFRQLAPRSYADLTPDEAERIELAEERLGEDSEARWWLAGSLPAPQLLERFADAQRRRLIFVHRERIGGKTEAEVAVVPPGSLLLRTEDVLRAARDAGHGIGPAAAERLVRASDGWWRPIQLALQEAADELPGSPEELVSIAAVAEFVDAVVAELPTSVREGLMQLAEAGVESPLDPVAVDLLGAAPAESLLLACERAGWLMEDRGRLRLPLLLADAVRRRADAQPLGWQRRVRQQVTRAFLTSAPTRAVASLHDHGEREEALLLLESTWAEALREIPAARLESICAELPIPTAPPLILLRRVIRGLAPGGVSGAGERLDGVRHQTEDPDLTIAAELLADAFRFCAGQERKRRREPDPPVPLLPLQSALQLASRADEPVELAEWKALWHTLGDLGGESLPPLAELTLRVMARTAERDLELAGWLSSRLPGLPAVVAEDLEVVETHVPRLTFRLRLLGLPIVERRSGDDPWQPVEGLLSREILALCAVALAGARGASRNWLVEHIFPGRSSSFVERNLHPTLSRLRKALTAGFEQAPDPLPYESGRWRLSRRYRWEVDLLREGELIEQGEDLLGDDRPQAAAGAWVEAWRLAEGEPLEGMEVEWLEPLREEWQARRVTLLHRLGALLEESGRTAEAVDVYRSVLALEPLAEEVHLRLMRLYRFQGRRDLVHRQYERLSRLLDERLSAHPSAETTVAFQEFMR